MTKEDEKYGNDGDKFNRIGRGFIGGVESVSNMLTSALSVNMTRNLVLLRHSKVFKHVDLIKSEVFEKKNT